jgi:peptidoglycan/LPS O-acetylase OafA/YrhL
MLFGFLAMAVGLFAQSELPPVPGSVWEAIGQFSYLVGSFAGAVVLMTFLVPFVLGGLNVQKKVLKYLVTVLCVAAIVVAAYFLSFGYLHGTYWWTIPLNVGFLMLVQVGLFAWDFVKNIQDKIYEKFNPWKPTE